MIYFLSAITLLVVFILVYYRYRKNSDTKDLIKTLFLVTIVIFFTYISKIIFVHKTIFVFHLALMLLSWYGLFFYLIKDRLNLFMILAPLATTLFFIAEALYFKDIG